jgi:hypothetical protein
METPTLSTPPTPGTLPPAGIPQSVLAAASQRKHGGGTAVPGCKCPACEGQRLKWRNKKLGGGSTPPAQPLAPAGKAIPPAPTVPSQTIPVDFAPPAVLWDASTLVPVLQQAADLTEKADVSSLAKEAEKISARCGDLVREKGLWPAAAKATLVSGGAKLCAKYLNKFGVSAEYQPEIEVAIAGMAIWQARASLLTEIRAMAAEIKKAAEKAAAVPKSA